MTDSPPTPNPSGRNVWSHLYAGTSLAVTILAFTYAGIRVDRHWNVTPWGTLVGAFIGIGAGLYNFIKEFSSDARH